MGRGFALYRPHDKPLQEGETFASHWLIRTGKVQLNWVITECLYPLSWTAEADTDFIGKIVLRYDIQGVK